MVGHLDWYGSSGIFQNLHLVEPKDRIQVTREDGATATFEVLRKETLSQEAFGTQKVYSKTVFPELRLITCTGEFLNTQGRYTHNLIVYAQLLDNL